MVKKTRRTIHDPALNDTIDGELTSNKSDILDCEDAGVFRGSEYHDDPLYFGDNYRDDARSANVVVPPPLPAKPRRGRSRFTYLLVCCGALAVIITMSVLISKNKSKDKSSSSSRTVALVGPSADLSTVCSLRNIESQMGRSQCQEACAPSQCCDYPVNSDLSCLAGNQDRCQLYHMSCANLNGMGQAPASNIPPAPTNLDDICGWRSLMSSDGITQCASACVPHRCCYSSAVPSCTSDENCMEYAICHNLETHDNIFPEIAQEVNDKCGNPATTQECRQICQTAACCFTPFSTCDYKGDQESFCRQYSGCKIRFDDTDELTWEPTAEPSSSYTEEPTIEPTAGNTEEPTVGSTEEPTAGNTEEPTLLSTTAEPSSNTEEPTPLSSTFEPTESAGGPTIEPTAV